jgi:hypothetical protein
MQSMAEKKIAHVIRPQTVLDRKLAFLKAFGHAG